MYGVTRLEVHEEVALISFAKLPCDLIVFSDIFGCYAQHGIILDMISQTSPVAGYVGLAFTCLDGDMVKVLEISKELSEKYPKLKPMVSSGNCKIKLLGEGMSEQFGVYARALQSLTPIGVELQQVTTSEEEISLLVTSVQAEDAVDALTRAFAL